MVATCNEASCLKQIINPQACREAPGNQWGKVAGEGWCSKLQTAGHPRCCPEEQDHTLLKSTPAPVPGLPGCQGNPALSHPCFLGFSGRPATEGQYPTQRSHKPGNHGAGVHSGLSGSRSPLPTSPQGSSLKPKSWRILEGTSESIPAHPWPAADAKMLLQGRPGS